MVTLITSCTWKEIKLSFPSCSLTAHSTVLLNNRSIVACFRVGCLAMHNPYYAGLLCCNSYFQKNVPWKPLLMFMWKSHKLCESTSALIHVIKNGAFFLLAAKRKQLISMGGERNRFHVGFRKESRETEPNEGHTYSLLVGELACLGIPGVQLIQCGMLALLLPLWS